MYYYGYYRYLLQTEVQIPMTGPQGHKGHREHARFAHPSGARSAVEILKSYSDSSYSSYYCVLYNMGDSLVCSNSSYALLKYCFLSL